MGFFSKMRESADANANIVEKQAVKESKKQEELVINSTDILNNRLNSPELMKKFILDKNYKASSTRMNQNFFNEIIAMLNSNENVLMCAYMQSYYCMNKLRTNGILIVFTNQRVMFCGKGVGTPILKKELTYPSMKVDIYEKKAVIGKEWGITLIAPSKISPQTLIEHSFLFYAGTTDRNKMAILTEMYSSILKIGNEYGFSQIDEKEQIKMKEHRRKCNVCGKIFVFTDDDLKRNLSNKKLGTMQALASGVNILAGGSKIDTYANQAAADRSIDRIVDYSRCPSCGSADLSVLTDEIKEEQPKEATNQVSSADEIRKFKELLDDGIISQEEFDKKKKELLGL